MHLLCVVAEKSARFLACMSGLCALCRLHPLTLAPDCRLFVRLMRLFCGQGVVSEDRCRDLLGMLPTLIDAGQQFYSEACSCPQALPAVFIRYSMYFRLLSHHCAISKDSQCLRLVEQMPDADKLFAARPEARGQGMCSFLIRPVSRLCKYPLLLRVRLVVSSGLCVY